MDGRNIEDEESTPLVAHDNTSRDHGIVPQLLTSVPTLNEAASYLSETTSYLTSCFPDIPEQMSGKLNVQDTETLSPANCAYQAINGTSSSDSGPAVYASSSMAYSAPPIQDGISRGVAGESSEQVALVKLGNSNQNGRVAGESSEQVALVKSGNSSQNGTPLFQGLIERVRKTVRGSADDIGWLQRASDMPPVEDGTERFDEILDEIRHGVHRLPSSMVYLLVPGLFSNHGPLYFVNTKTSFSKMGLTCHIAKIHSEASVEKNAREIKEYIEELYWGSNKRVMLLGHSKGGVDAAAALSMYWSDLKDKVAGLAFAQSPFGGSPIASDILREGQLGDYVNMRKLTELLICKVIKGDMQALEDLTYEKRKEFLKKYSLPSELPLVSFHTEASISPAVLATLSRVAHADLPLFTPLAAGQSATLPVVMPLGAVMAACAQLLQMRYGEKSDGLVTCRDAEVPGSVVVRPKRKLDHAWMVYSSLNDDPLEVNATMVCEALLYLLIEAGHKKKHEFEKKDE